MDAPVLDFHAFRLSIADRITEASLRARGTLRPSQLCFLRDALLHYCLATGGCPSAQHPRHVGFYQQFTGSGKTINATLVCLGLLYSAPHYQAQPRTLLTVPSDGGRQDLLAFLQSPQRLMSLFGLTHAEALVFTQHVYCYRAGSCRPDSPHAEEFASAWVVVATPQSLAPDAGQLPPDAFSEYIVDEADFGSVRTPLSTEHSWCTIAERLVQLRCLVLQSATQHRSDGIPLPPPFSVYNYQDALRDRVVKSLQVYYLVPQAVPVLRDGRPPSIRSASSLRKPERRAVLESPQAISIVLQRAIQLWLDHRSRTGVCWQLHVLVDHPGGRALAGVAGDNRIESIGLLLQGLLDAHTCPLTGAALRCCWTWGGMSPLRARQQIESFASFERDIIISCKKLSRSVSFPLLGVTLVLKEFAKLGGQDAYTQTVIGRTIRRASAQCPLIQAHPHFPLFGHRLLDAVDQPALVLELETNQNRPLVMGFAAEHGVSVPVQSIPFLLAPVEPATHHDTTPAPQQHANQMPAALSALLSGPLEVVCTELLQSDRYRLLTPAGALSAPVAAAAADVASWASLCEQAWTLLLTFLESAPPGWHKQSHICRWIWDHHPTGSELGSSKAAALRKLRQLLHFSSAPRAVMQRAEARLSTRQAVEYRLR